MALFSYYGFVICNLHDLTVLVTIIKDFRQKSQQDMKVLGVVSYQKQIIVLAQVEDASPEITEWFRVQLPKTQVLHAPENNQIDWEHLLLNSDSRIWKSNNDDAQQQFLEGGVPPEIASFLNGYMYYRYVM